MCKVFVDFDGTISLEDTCNALMDRYADPAWREIDDRWSAGELSTMDATKEIFQLVKLSREEIRSFALTLEIDTSFIHFVEYCEKKHWPVYILSDGYDLLIETILEKYGLSSIPFYSNVLVVSGNKLSMQCPYFHSDYPKQGVAKVKIYEELRDQKSRGIFIGDGASDIYVAEKADILFAKKKLQAYCGQKGIKHFPFTTFDDIMNQLSTAAFQGSL